MRLSPQVTGHLNHTPTSDATGSGHLREQSLKTTLCSVIHQDPTINADIIAIGTICSCQVYRKTRILMHSIHSLFISTSKSGSLWTAGKTRDTTAQGILLLPRASLHFISYPTQLWSLLKSYRTLDYLPFWMSKPAAIMSKSIFLTANVRINEKDNQGFTFCAFYLLIR